MKTFKKLLSLLILISIFLSCKKKERVEIVKELNKEEIQKKQIQNIIPEQYLDSLKKLGLVINTGLSPVNVEGSYALAPMILEATNIKNDFALGYRFSDSKLSLSNQKEDFSIKLLGKYFLAERDSSISTAVSGSGNDFTIYGRIKSEQAGQVAEFAVIISGTLADKTFKNLKYGLISVSNKNPEPQTQFISEGKGRVVLESDKLSSTITDQTFRLAIQNNPLLKQVNGGSAPIF